MKFYDPRYYATSKKNIGKSSIAPDFDICRHCGHGKSYVGTNGECAKWIEFDVFPYTLVICGCDQFEPKEMGKEWIKYEL